MYKGYQNTDDDITVANGDFVKAEVGQDHIPDILKLNQGEIRQNILVGPNLIKYLNSPNTVTNRLKMQKVIRLQLVAQNYTVSKVAVESFEAIKIDAEK